MTDRPLVMVVEDDVEMNQLERELLEVHGLNSVPAYTGPQALDLYGTCNADAILMDIMLPELDGLETIRRIRHLNCRHVPIVILSALDTEDCRRRGFEYGADAYFAKPFDPDEVVQMLQSLITANAGQ